MSEDNIFRVVEAYENAINEDTIVGARCDACHAIFVPPRPICRDCGGSKMTIEPVEGKGKLLTWTAIHISPPSYMDMAPYVVGIVELTNGERLTGIVLGEGDKLQIGMNVEARFAEGKENASRLRWVTV